MYLTITSTAPDASNLGYLLHKHPDRAQTFDMSGGVAHVFYPESSSQRCTVALLLEVDPIALIRRRSGVISDFALGQYVNDRPYAASSLLSVALGKVFRTALSGTCRSHLDLVTAALPLEIRVPVVPTSGGVAQVAELFEPLGWTVDADQIALDESMPAWGMSRYVDLRLTGTQVLATALSHLYVLLPVLDGVMHYWVDEQEVDKRCARVRRGFLITRCVPRSLGAIWRVSATSPIPLWRASRPSTVRPTPLRLRLSALARPRLRQGRGWEPRALRLWSRRCGLKRRPRRRCRLRRGCPAVDRGPDSAGVLRLAMGMVAAGHAMRVPGNHEHKLVRALNGAAVRATHGLETTLAELSMATPEFRDEVRDFCDSLVAHLVLDDGALVVAHAGPKEAYHGRASGRVRSFALYGDSTGEADEFGLPVRYPWANDYRGKAMVLYGHTPVPETEWVTNTLCLDTGCVFGGHLSAMRYPEREIVSVPAEQVWYEPVKPLRPEPVPSSASDRTDGSQLNLDDMVGKRVIDTGHHGRVSVHEDNAAGALEVMSRFALPPHLVPYLPPTMAPAATSARVGVLEHPAEAFSAYHKHGVRDLICEEKHMGSRAMVLLCADAGVAERVWGCAKGQTGVVYTRTGRSFFDAADTETFLGRLRAAVSDAGLWAELDTDWMLFDAEIVPWSLKAEQLLCEQYASVAAAAAAVMPVALGGLAAAGSRGIDVGDLLSATAARADNAASFRTAYRQYCWTTEGVDGVQVAPFQILATAGATHSTRARGHRQLRLDGRRYAVVGRPHRGGR